MINYLTEEPADDAVGKNGSSVFAHVPKIAFQFANDKTTDMIAVIAAAV